MRHGILTLLALGLAALPAAAQETYRHGRVLYLEPGVVLQRATEAGAEEAVVNLPFLPGDRVWTDGTGRADFQFPDGTRLRLDSRSKIDYAAHDEGRGELVVARLWSGGLYLHVRGGDRGASYEVETPGGLVEADGDGVYRLDVDSGEARLTVYEGEATLDSGRRRVRVRAGERTYARSGESPEEPRPFEDELDDFARWDQDRERHDAWAASSRRYLPDELGAYAPEFETHGTWYHEAEVGHVWRPFVTVGWRPYLHGRWVWTAYGWTWVPGERWGWAPFHYGRWGHSGALGWYWIPGRTWGPAWVSWASGGDYLGWCPLGRYDRPVTQPRFRGYGGPRGGLEAGAAWTFVRRGEIASRDLARRRVEVGADLVRDLRIADSPRMRPTRDARELREAGVAVPRNIRIKPTPGDTVPELQRDNQTQVGVGPWTPSARRRGRDDSRHDEREGAAGTRDRVVARPSGEREAGRARPTDVRSPARSRPLVGETVGGAPRPAGGEASGARERQQRAEDPERDVRRRIFRPLSEPRGVRGDGEGRTRERDESPARPRDDGWRSGNEGRSRPRDTGSGYSRPRESSPPRSEPRSVAPRSEPRSAAPRSEPRSAAPRSQPRSAEPRSAAPRSAAPRSEPRAAPRSAPRSSGPPPSSGGAKARPRKDRP